MALEIMDEDKSIPMHDTISIAELSNTLHITKAEAFMLLALNSKEVFAEFPDVITIEDMMAMLHIGRNTAYQLLRENRVQSIRVGKKYIIPKSCVIEFLRKLS